MLQCPFHSRIKQSADKLVHFICMISNDKVILHRIFLVTTHGVQANGHKFIVAMTIQLLWRFNEQDRQSRFVPRHICWYRYKKCSPRNVKIKIRNISLQFQIYQDESTRLKILWSYFFDLSDPGRSTDDPSNIWCVLLPTAVTCVLHTIPWWTHITCITMNQN